MTNFWTMMHFANGCWAGKACTFRKQIKSLSLNLLPLLHILSFLGEGSFVLWIF